MGIGSATCVIGGKKMQVGSKRIHFRSRTTTYKLYPIGDIHSGVKACAEDKIKERIKEIRDDPFALWVGMGDYGDYILPNDVRFDHKQIAEWCEQDNIAECQVEWLAKLFEPITNKCLGLIRGNHDEDIRGRHYTDVQLNLCKKLGVQDLGFSCFYRLHFMRGTCSHTVDCHFSHGSGAAQTEGGKVMRLAKTMLAFRADITAIGHLHDIKINAIPELYLNDNYEIKQKVRVGAITGSWFRAYSEGAYPTYAEAKCYTPTNLGCPHFLIKPDKQFVGVDGGP